MNAYLNYCKSTCWRTHTCNDLNLSDVGKIVTLSGWIQKCRNMGSFTFLDLRDRYGITQCVFNKSFENNCTRNLERYKKVKKLGREYVIQITGVVKERLQKNKNRFTGEIEIVSQTFNILSEAEVPPFKIEDDTDGNEEIRLKYRYLDIRRNPVKNQLMLRSNIARILRETLWEKEFCEIETPYLIKSTPEGARDFIVPSRMNIGQFYALPQSPQIFKQILMVSGMDRYFQIVKCFRDEELRAYRQLEFTQLDCEMSHVTQKDVLDTFEDLVRVVFRKIINYELPKLERMTYDQSIKEYGIDKPDLRFGMKLTEVNNVLKGNGLKIIDNAELIIAIKIEKVSLKGGPFSTNKKLKSLEKLAKSQLIKASGLIWLKVLEGKFYSSFKKFLNKNVLEDWAKKMNAKNGDLICAFAGSSKKIREQMGIFRAEIGKQLGLRHPSCGFSALWIIDFPLLKFDEDKGRYTSMHHPFTSPKEEDRIMMKINPIKVRANAYDMVINGVEVGGGSIRIHDHYLQKELFELLGFTEKEVYEKFGFLLNAFKYGAPPHGGLAFGFDRLCTILGGALGLNHNSIRDYIAFPKNNQGRDSMINSPSFITFDQLEEFNFKSFK